jgi:hypothetical protein
MEDIRKGDYIKGIDCAPYKVCLVVDVKNCLIEYIFLNGKSAKAVKSTLRLATEKEIKTEWI